MTTVTEPTSSTPLFDRARVQTFGPRPDYIGSAAWCEDRTEAAAELAALAIERLDATATDLIARACAAALYRAPTDREVAAHLLTLGCELFASRAITDLERLLFSEVALPWHRPLSRLDAVTAVQDCVDDNDTAGASVAALAATEVDQKLAAAKR